MGIARGFGLAVTEKAADDRQLLAQRQRPGSGGMADVRNAHVVQPGPRGGTASTSTAAGDRGTVQSPIFPSRMRISAQSR